MAAAALPMIIEGCAAVAAAVGLLDLINNRVEQIASNAPGAKHAALKAAREQLKKKHEETNRTINQCRVDSDTANQAAEAAASRRIKEEREANNKVLEEIRLGIRAEEEKSDARMKELQHEHDEKMASLRTETKETRDAAEREHLEKVGEIERKHEAQKADAQRKLDLAKVEGDEKVERAKRERDAVMKKREDELKVFEEETKKFMEAHQKCLTSIRKQTNMLRIANEREERLQIEEKNKLRMKQLEECAMSLAANFTLDASRKLVRIVFGVLQPGLEAKDALQFIRAKCSALDDAGIEPGILTPHFEVLKQVKDTFQHNYSNYQIFLIDYHRADRQLEDKCENFINKLKNILGSDDMAGIIANFQAAIDSNKQDRIERYCKISKELCDKIGEDPQAEIQNHLRNVINNHTNNAIQVQNQNLNQLE